MRLALGLFAETDFRHGIVSPAVLLLGRAAGETRAKSAGEVGRAVFLAGTAVEYMENSGRMVPETFGLLGRLARTL